MQTIEVTAARMQAMGWEMIWNALQLITERQLITESLTPNFYARINNLLLTDFIGNTGNSIIGNWKVECMEAWAANSESNEQQQLLLILGRILLINSHDSCACLRYCKQRKEIQIAFPSTGSTGSTAFDQEGWDTLRHLLALQEEEPLEIRKITEVRRKLFAKAIEKDSFAARGKKANKTKSILAGGSKDKQNAQIFKQLKASMEEFSKQWEMEKQQRERKQKLNFDDSAAIETSIRMAAMAVDIAIKNFFTSYENYYRLMQQIAADATVRANGEQQSISSDLLTPLIHVYDISYWLVADQRKSEVYSELAAAIRTDSLRKVLTSKKQHAEMKILEDNNFAVGIFAKARWPAVITKSPCLNCWMMLWTNATSDKKKRIITERLGCSGSLYLGWGVPTLPAELLPAITNNYFVLAREIATMLHARGDGQWGSKLDLGNSHFAGRIPINNRSPVEVTLLQQELRQQSLWPSRQGRDLLLTKVAEQHWQLTGSWLETS